MKRYCIALSLLLLSVSCWSADEIYAPNQDGFELAFVLRTENTVKLVPPFERYSWDAGGIYKDITTDTLHIPESIVYNGQQYTVTMLEEGALWKLADTIRVVTIPQTIDTIAEPDDPLTGLALAMGVEKFIVDPRNSHYCSDEQGLVYTADMKFLLMCPMKASFDTLRLDNRIEDIGPVALTCLYSLRYLEMPAALKRIQASSFTHLDSLKQLIVKDSIEELAGSAFRMMGELEKITLGANLKKVNSDFITLSPNVSEITLRAPIPPAVSYQGSTDHTFLKTNIQNGCRLLVPQKSIKAYKQVDGWSQFGDNIFPIEPPIMATDEGVTISWVQSFSATGYVWYMYQDEAHTQLVMSLMFDQGGRLTEMAFGPAFGSSMRRAPAYYAENEDESAERFAEYYSFTIKNLSDNTDYYYTRQTLSGEEVIDSEDGTFNTNPNHVSTGNNSQLANPDQTIKTIENGNIVIHSNGKRYLLNGTEMK